MSHVRNIEGLSASQIDYELSKGARFVVFPFCISIVVMTFRRSSGVYFIRAGESAFKYNMGYIIISVLLGWWGIPWGPIFTIGSLYANLRGGKDVTQALLASMNQVDK